VVKQFLRRVVKKLVTIRTLLPISYDAAAVRLSSTSASILSSPARKLGAAAPFLLAAAALAALGASLWAGVAFVPSALILGPPLRRRLMMRVRVWRVASAPATLTDLPSARSGLLQLGLEATVVDRILSGVGGDAEVLIAEFDQENRLLSHIGHIPAFEHSLTDAEECTARRRHRVSLAVTANTLAIKKAHRDFVTFGAELLALRALQEVAGVPRLLRARRHGRLLYQSFQSGWNLGSALAASGIPISLQHSLESEYPGRGKWSERDGATNERSRAVGAVRTLVDGRCLDHLGQLFTAVHRAGVAIRDVKYGNVIVRHGKPSLCDFDGAEVFPNNSRRFVAERERDRDKFNYLFGPTLLTEHILQKKVSALAGSRHNLLCASVHYGKGYRVGGMGSTEVGSGKWLFIRRMLPDLRGRSVLDLGCNNGLLSLEMLRAGAARVVASEIDPAMARLARLNHEWFEFVDNRKYEFELIEGYMRGVCDRDITGYDVATAFCGLYCEDPENMRKIVQALSEKVSVFVVQCNESQRVHSGELMERSSRAYLQHLLAENGFPHQKVFRYFYYSRPVIVARSAKSVG
jgi:2-polyprenyl-3-methyl-5-hydroxy-6-metoxy-1,4-benzoquinol methylase